MSTDYSGRHIVITGGTGGLGSKVVEALLEAGATCHIPCFENETPKGFAYADHERVKLAFSIDLTSEDAVTAYYKTFPALWASIHLAGGFEMSSITETSLAAFDAMFQRNTVSAFLCCREAVRAMRRTGGGGRIVNVAARPAVEPTGGMIAYSTSKAGVASISQCLAAEVKAEGIFVNAVLPSIIDTAANRAAMPDADFDSWPKPAELARSICFLASTDNTLMSGALVPLYGRA